MSEKLLEEQITEFFEAFTEDGETVALDDVLDAVPHCGLTVEDPSLMRILVLLDDAGVSRLTLSDLLTLFMVQDPPLRRTAWRCSRIRKTNFECPLETS